MSKNIILLFNKNLASGEIETVKGFSNWDWAELQLINIAKENLFSSNNYYLKEIPFIGETESGEIEVTASGSELVLKYKDETLYGEIEIIGSTYEEWTHQEIPPKQIPTIEIEDILICGESLNRLKLSKELKKDIEYLAEKYKEEREKEL